MVPKEFKESRSKTIWAWTRIISHAPKSTRHFREGETRNKGGALKRSRAVGVSRGQVFNETHSCNTKQIMVEIVENFLFSRMRVDKRVTKVQDSNLVLA